MIRIRNLNKSFVIGNKAKRVLKNIDLDFQKGKIYLIKGVSGCGKTTLLNILAGLDTEFEGDMHFYKSDIKKSRSARDRYRKNVGYITQQSLLIERFTIRENLQFINDNDELIDEYLKAYNLSRIADKYPTQISGGERQRVAVIRSLICKTDIIIADEPTSALDKKNSMKFVEEINKIKHENRIIIICTHKNIFDNIADEIINLNYGVTESNVIEMSSKDFLYVPKKKSGINNRFLLLKNLFYCIKRTNIKKEIIISIIFSIFIMLFYLGVAVYKGYNREYIKLFSEKNPLQIIEVNTADLDRIHEYIDYEIMPNYTIQEDVYSAYTLFDKKDSNFNMHNTIKYGKFPSNNDEVLITEKYARDVMFVEAKNAVGQDVIIKNITLKIAGVINDNGDIYKILQCNGYYPKEIGNYIFIPIEKMKLIGQDLTKQKDVSMIKVDVDYYNDKRYAKLLTNTFITSFDNWWNNIENKTCTTLYYIKTIFYGIIALAIIGIILIWTHIKLELFYRKKEFGYLQIFGVNKKRITFIMFWEYLQNIIIANILAVGLFKISSMLIYRKTQMLFDVSITNIMAIIVIILGYTFFVVGIPVSEYYRKNITQLIKE